MHAYVYERAYECVFLLHFTIAYLVSIENATNEQNEQIISRCIIIIRNRIVSWCFFFSLHHLLHYNRMLIEQCMFSKFTTAKMWFSSFSYFTGNNRYQKCKYYFGKQTHSHIRVYIRICTILSYYTHAYVPWCQFLALIRWFNKNKS